MLDEADRLLNMDFEQEIDQILKVIPKVRRPAGCPGGQGGEAVPLGEAAGGTRVACAGQAAASRLQRHPPQPAVALPSSGPPHTAHRSGARSFSPPP